MAIDAARNGSISVGRFGEVVCLDENGRSSFRLLQQRFHLEGAAEVQARMRKFPATIYLFDVLYLDRYDVRGLPLQERPGA